MNLVRLTLLLFVALVASPVTASVYAQGGKTATPAASKPGLSKADAASRRARWNKLSKEEQAELLSRHKRLQSLAPEERAKLESRAKRVQREMAEIEASLSEEELAALNKLGRKDRQGALRKLVAERASVAAAMVRTKMTPQERARIEAARPEERAEMLRVLRKRELDQLSERLIELGKELGFSAQRLQELSERPRHEQRKAIVTRLRRRLESDVAENGLPEKMTEKRWERICSQEDMGFLRSVERIRSRHPKFGLTAKQWERRLRRGGSIATRLESLMTPSDRLRERSPNASESSLRRRMTLDRRHRIEQLIGRECRLHPGVIQRLESLSSQEFLPAVMAAKKLIEEGADVGGGLNRWLDGRQRRREGKKR